MSIRSYFSTCLLALACLCGAAQAQVQFDENALRAFVSQQVTSANGDTLSRFDVKLGSLDVQATLAPCRRIEPFVPGQGRFWGRSSLGVRCADGAGWTVLVPVTVSAWGRAIVAANPLAAGTVLSAQDVREQDVELTREPAGLLRDATSLAGKTLSRAVNAGQALRADMVRVTSVIQAGDPVRLRIAGPGFAVAATGQALNAAGDGQSVRVRTELGKILVGVAREGRLVDVSL